jgi:hypothetical protein
MRHLLLKARKDPQKTAGISVLTILLIGALVLYVAYLRMPPAAKPQTIAIYPTKPATRPATRPSELLEDSLIIQANSAAQEQRRHALNQVRALRTLDRGPVRSARRAPQPPRERGVLERLFSPRTAAAATPTTSPTTRASR